MNKDYKEYFKNINPSNDLKEKIFNKTIYKEKNNINLKLIYTSLIILFTLTVTTTIIYANDIYNYIIEYHEKENYIEIKPPINYKLNTQATLLNCYTVNDFEQDLEIDLLESTMLDSTLKLFYKLYNTDKNLQRVTLYKKIETSDYFNNLDNLQKDLSKIELKYVILTKYATKKQINNFNLTYSSFKKENLEKIYNNKLNTHMYYYTNDYQEKKGYSPYSIRPSIMFVYNDVLYQIEGHYVSKDMLLTIANSFE